MFKKNSIIFSLILLQSITFADQNINNDIDTNKTNNSTVENKRYNLDICKQCHGYHWEKQALGLSKIVSNMDQESINKSLIGYSNRTYGGIMKNIMKGHLKNYSENDLNNIAFQIKPTNDTFYNKN